MKVCDGRLTIHQHPCKLSLLWKPGHIWRKNKQIYQSDCNFMKYNIERLPLSVSDTDKINWTWLRWNVSFLSAAMISMKSQVCFTHGLQINFRHGLCHFILFSMFHHCRSQSNTQDLGMFITTPNGWGLKVWKPHQTAGFMWDHADNFTKNISVIITWEFAFLHFGELDNRTMQVFLGQIQLQMLCRDERQPGEQLH